MKFRDSRSRGTIRKGNLTILKHQGHPPGGERVSRSTCARCRGFMVPSFTDALLVEIGDTSATPAWRCVNCGNWIDATVAVNQKHTETHISASFNRFRWGTFPHPSSMAAVGHSDSFKEENSCVISRCYGTPEKGLLP